MKPETASIEAIGECAACGSYLITYFGVFGSDDGIGQFLKSVRNDPEDIPFKGLEKKISGIVFLGVQPAVPDPVIPKYLPDNIARALLEAEKAQLSGLWSSAAAMYRKAVDRGVTDILARKIGFDRNSTDQLGTKLGKLERTNLLPEMMLEWIRLVKEGGNFALHDDDRDFNSREEIDSARRFAHLLLEYLFTLPEEVKRAREED